MDTAVALLYASERSLLLRGLVFLCVILALAAASFAFLYGSVRPRLKRKDLIIKALRADRLVLRTERAASREKVAALEGRCLDFARELDRVDAIRRRTEEGCRAKHDELQLLTAQRDMLLGRRKG